MILSDIEVRIMLESVRNIFTIAKRGETHAAYHESKKDLGKIALLAILCTPCRLAHDDIIGNLQLPNLIVKSP